MDSEVNQPMIQVIVRKRPLSKKEISRGQQDAIDIPAPKQVTVKEQKLKVDLTRYVEEHNFHFDGALDHFTDNQQLYEQHVHPLLQCAFKGAKVTCFAYGQTGSGKTYTMNGSPEQGVLGMYYLAAEDLFLIKNQFYPKMEVYLSFYEIYCSKLFDLLNGREQLQAREDGRQNVNIIGLTLKKVTSPQEFMSVVTQGSSLRITSQNSTNADSSRSHAILQLQLRQGKQVQGKVTFIDLAGCERGADTLQQNKQTKIDGAEINKSLLALKECIRALDQGKTHTPFRGSKLTMVLKDSFSGFCRTLMIANIAPGASACENTLNTLRYADRVKTLKKPQSHNFRSLNRPLSQSSSQEKQEDPLRYLVPKGQKAAKKGLKEKEWAGKRGKDENESAKELTINRQNGRENGSKNQSNWRQPLSNFNNGLQKKKEERNKSVFCRQKVYKNSKEQTEGLHKKGSLFKMTESVEPSQWDKSVACFRNWCPKHSNFGQMSDLFEQMVGMLMKEEVQLGDCHRSVLMGEEQRQQWLGGLYEQSQNEQKGNGEMIAWAGRLASGLQERTQALAELQRRALSYQNHLKEHEFCEERLIKGAHMLSEEPGFSKM